MTAAAYDVTPQAREIVMTEQRGLLESLATPWVESPFFAALLPGRNLTPELAKLAVKYNADGYVVLENAVSDELANRIVTETASLYQPNVSDGPRSYYRVQDGWQQSPAVQELASSSRILNTLEQLYGRRPFPFQTLNFRHGSQQRGHSDQIHFSAIPGRFMCGVWAALEDVDESNGPLFYYPGSHRLPEYDLYDLGMSLEAASYPRYEDLIDALMTNLGFERRTLCVKKGSVLIWSSNIVHGGSPIMRANATRFSQVTHYYFDNCIYYTPYFSNRKVGEYFWRKDVIDIRTKQVVPQSYDGRLFRPVGLSNGRHLFDLGGGVEWTNLDARIKGMEDEMRVLRESGALRVLNSGGRWFTRAAKPYRRVRDSLRRVLR